MKKLSLASILLSVIIFIGCVKPIPEKDKYLGQTPPGNTPQILQLEVTPGTFAAERIAISKDGKELYYSEVLGYYPNRGEKIRCYKFENGSWSKSIVLFDGFTGPALSLTEDTLFFENDFKMYLSIRSKNGWSNPQRCFEADSVHYLQITSKGNYYASARSESSVGLADWSKFEKGGNEFKPVSLGFPINTIADNLDFYIDKDENFIITCLGGPIGISYPDGKGKWSNSRYLNSKINFGIGGWGAYVSPDGKYLFYTTGTKMDYSDTYVYWVSLGNVVDSMRQTNLPPYVKNKPKSQLAAKGKPFSFTIPNDAVCDDDGQAIDYEVLLIDGKPLPAWLTFDLKSRTLSGTPKEVGDVILRINAYDDKKVMAAFRFIITVKEK